MELGSRPSPRDDSEEDHIKIRLQELHASRDEEPQYLIKSDKTDHIALHKGSALRKIKKR